MTSNTSFIVELAGWMPAVICPSATAIQLWKILRKRTAEGVSVLTWVLFGVANIGLYIHAEKYFSLQSIIALLVTAVLDFIIVGLMFSFKLRSSNR